MDDAAAISADAHDAAESSRDVSDPTSGPPDPDPRVGHAVAHVWAACLQIAQSFPHASTTNNRLRI